MSAMTYFGSSPVPAYRLFIVSAASKHRHSHSRDSERSMPMPGLNATPRYRSFLIQGLSTIRSG